MQNNSDFKQYILEAIRDKKGEKITTIDLSDVEAASVPEFIICQGRNISQVAAIADNIREELNIKLKLKPSSYDGYRNAQWIILDYGSVMIHIFLPEFRQLYRLEELWSDGKIINLPDFE